NQSTKEHFNQIAQDPLHEMNLKVHGGILEKIKNGDWKEAFNIDFETVDKEFFKKNGEALLTHAQSVLDPELAGKIKTISEEDQKVLRIIQFEMLRRTNMTEKGQ